MTTRRFKLPPDCFEPCCDVAAATGLCEWHCCQPRCAACHQTLELTTELEQAFQFVLRTKLEFGTGRPGVARLTEESRRRGIHKRTLNRLCDWWARGKGQHHLLLGVWF